MGASSRRAFAAAVAGVLLGACGNRARTATSAVRLHSRPGAGTNVPEPGVYPLRLREHRDALLYVPHSVPQDRPAAFIVFLHGAGGDEQHALRFLTPYADTFGFVLLAPSSEAGTWDAIGGAYGRDVRFLDHALGKAFQMCRVDAAKLAISGFSDGASYALGLGLSNGDLFPHVLAFSPGFVPTGGQRTGEPRVYVSHGTNDRVLPIEHCSRVIVPKLTKFGYAVTYHEFDGPHTLPRDVGDAAFRWFLS